MGKRAVTLVACVLLGACGDDDGSDASDGSGAAHAAGGPFEVW